jgi:hypothetical protein
MVAEPALAALVIEKVEQSPPLLAVLPAPVRPLGLGVLGPFPRGVPIPSSGRQPHSVHRLMEASIEARDET